MIEFGIYIDRDDLVEKTAKALSTCPIHFTGWLMCETADGRMRVKTYGDAREAISLWWDSGARGPLQAVVWPRDGQRAGRYTHLYDAGMLIRADVEGQDRDGHLERSDDYTGGVTSFPFHKIIKDWQHPVREEVQVYPTHTNETLESKAEGSIPWAVGLTGATGVALPLYGLTGSDGAVKHGSPRAFLGAMVRECLKLGVEEVTFWSAKHLWKNDYALPFLTEDLPKILEEHILGEASASVAGDARGPSAQVRSALLDEAKALVCQLQEILKDLG